MTDVNPDVNPDETPKRPPDSPPLGGSGSPQRDAIVTNPADQGAAPVQATPGVPNPEGTDTPINLGQQAADDLNAENKREAITEVNETRDALASEDNALAYSDEPYIGVDPIYKNYAHPTLAPYMAEEGPERPLEQQAIENQESLIQSVDRPRAAGGESASVGGLATPDDDDLTV